MKKQIGIKGAAKLMLFVVIIVISVLLLFSSYLIGRRTRDYNISKENNIKKSSPKIKSVQINEIRSKAYVNIKKGNETNELISARDKLKIAYLTFDDGPSPNNTPKILETLAKYNVKATFFVIGKNAQNNPELLIRERDAGHEIAIHSFSHVVSIIYRNPEAYLQDIGQCSETVKKIVGKDGYRAHLIRFPGGSSGLSAGFKESIANAGYAYVDWNSLVGDAEKPKMMPVDYLMNRLETTSANHRNIVVLMHDAASKNTTAEALPKVIEYLKAQGYTFERIP